MTRRIKTQGGGIDRVQSIANRNDGRPVNGDAAIALFTYGTLQLPAVQLEKYGRLLSGEIDALPGYRIEPLVVDDPDILRLSGKAQHPIGRYSGDSGDRIAGIVYLLTAEELAVTDAYEVAPYVRTEVMLESGRTAFAYLISG